MSAKLEVPIPPSSSMKTRIKNKIAAALDAEMMRAPQLPRQFEPTFLIEEAQLEARIEEIFGRLPSYKNLFTPQEVAFALAKPAKWVRERFKKNPHCFDTGNTGTRIFLSIPRTT